MPQPGHTADAASAASASPDEPSGLPFAILELDLQPEDSSRLLRLPALAAHRAGRIRTIAVNLVWHDTADLHLAGQGRSLCESRGLWRLEKLSPDDDAPWLPATPAPLIAEAASPAALNHLCGTPLATAPTAAFTGRQRTVPLAGGLQLTILEGTLRGVLQDRPICRLSLAGEPQPIADFAKSIAASLAVQPPRASLAAQAFAVARGAPLAPRRRGAPRVPPDATIGAALTIITAHLADTLLFWAAEIPGAQSPEPVHQMRVAIRRLRSTLTAFRRALPDHLAWLDELAPRLKSLAALLGDARDWDVFLETTGADVKSAFPDDRRIAAMISGAARKQAAAYASLRAYLATPEWRLLCLTLVLLPTTRPWEPASAPLAEYARHALARRLKHVLANGDDLTDLKHEALHEIRKQAKRLRYAIEIFGPCFAEKSVRKYLGKLETLQEDFGTLNDTAVAGALAASLGIPFAAGAVQGYGAARSTHALKKLHKGWAKFDREAPFWE